MTSEEKRKLKDYLHFYTGFHVELHEGEFKKIDGKNPGGKLIGPSLESDRRWMILNDKGRVDNVEIIDIKLYLREVSELMDDKQKAEKKEIINAWDSQLLPWESGGLQTKALIEKGFDVFGLIKAGLAYRNKLPPSVENIHPALGINLLKNEMDKSK